MKKMLNSINRKGPKKGLVVLVIILFSFGMFIAVIGALMPKTPSEIRQEMIEDQFSYDGSHSVLKLAVRKKLIVPDTFEHIRTNYQVNGDMLIVKMDYSVKNPFGVRVQHRAIGAFKIDGECLNLVYGWE